MKQFKALLLKEWRTHWTSILTPAWFTGGVYAIALLGLILGLIKGNGINFNSMSGDFPAGMASFMLWTSTAGATMLLGSIGIISAIALADSMLNGGFKRRCEILHLSQPVKISKIVMAKYTIIIGGTIIMLAVLSLLNSLVISAAFAYFAKTHLYFGLCGWLQGSIEISLSLIFVASMYWFFAGLFKRKSFFMGTLTILAIQATISILNYTAGLHIPSLLQYIGRLASVNLSVNAQQVAQELTNATALIDSKWQQMLSWDTVLKIIYAVIFYFGGFLLYKRRELK